MSINAPSVVVCRDISGALHDRIPPGKVTRLHLERTGSKLFGEPWEIMVIKSCSRSTHQLQFGQQSRHESIHGVCNDRSMILDRLFNDLRRLLSGRQPRRT